MKTSTYITMGLYDDTAKDDLSVSVEGDIQYFSDLDNFQKEQVHWPKYATLEPGRTRLDGTFVPFPDDMEEEWGLWSLHMSDENGRFVDPVVLTMEFTQEHACVGLSFHFDEAAEEWAGKVLIQWYGKDDLPLASEMAEPGSANYFLHKYVDHFTKIVITFYGTSRPRRYLKLANLDYGKMVVFDENNIIEADLVEEISQTGEELSYNQLELDVFSEDEAYHILNPSSLSSGFRQRQKLQVTEFLDGEAVEQGVFYLDEWQASSENRTAIKAIDIVGVIGNETYEGGMYEGATVGEIAGDILGEIEYKMDDRLTLLPIKGWLPYTTKRAALNQLALACCCIIDTSGDGVIKMYPREERARQLIGYADKWMGESGVELKPTITAIELTSHRYAKGLEAERKNVFSGEVVGESVATFREACHGYRITGGTIKETHPNYVSFVGSGEVTITGIPYVHNTSIITVENSDVPTGVEGNVVTITDATLVSPLNAEDVADNLMRYYKQNYLVSYRKLLTTKDSLSQTQEIMTFRGQKIRGNVESLSKSLSHGYYADVVVAGYRTAGEFLLYMPELFAGDGGMI